MCAVRNRVQVAAPGSGILDHWEMCAVRNVLMRAPPAPPILDHWEMCAVRNQRAWVA